MASEFDDSDFVDCDFKAAEQSAHPPQSTAQHPTSKSVSPVSSAPGSGPALTPTPTPTPTPTGSARKPPSTEELDERVTLAQQKITELKRAKEALERERSELEEDRRRRLELHTGREEMLQNLTRGIGLLEEAEFAARRDAEQMARSLVELREALATIKAIQEDSWTEEDWSVELTRALTGVENARMEWNSARLKWTFLNPASSRDGAGTEGSPVEPGGLEWLESKGFRGLCRIGLALTWPVAAAVLAASALVLAFLWNP